MKNSFPAFCLLAAFLSLASCRNESFERNREQLVRKTEITGAPVRCSLIDLDQTKESFVDLYIGLNTRRHEKRFTTLDEAVRYLAEVIFSDRIPKEYIRGENKIVEQFDGSGGWVLTFADNGNTFTLGLNVAGDGNRPVLIHLKEK